MTKAIKVQFLFPQTILRYDSFLVFSLSMFEIPFLVNFHLSFFYSSKLKVKKILSWLSEFLWCFVVSQEVEVNLIITDYCMPGMTGYDLLKKIKVCFWFLLLCLLSRPSWYSLSAFSPIFPIEDLFFFFNSSNTSPCQHFSHIEILHSNSNLICFENFPICVLVFVSPLAQRKSL